MRDKVYVINLIATILEYVLLFVILQFLVFDQFLHVLYVMVPLFLLMLYLGQQTRRNAAFTKNKEEAKEAEEFYQDYLPDIKEASNLKGEAIDYYIVEMPNLFSSAFELNGKIYFNKAYTVKKMYLKGIIDHELGHVISNFGWKIVPAYYRPTTLLGGTLRYLGNIVSRNKRTRFFVYPLFIPYYLFNIVNRYILFNHMKNEEHVANKYAIKLGGGDSLRTHYFQMMMQSMDTLNVFDFSHPKISEMIEVMNHELGYKEDFELDLYWVDDKIRFVTRKDMNERSELIHKWYLHKSDLTKGSNLLKLAKDYQDGSGTPIDKEKAIEYYEKAIKVGNIVSYYPLGLLYEEKGRDEEAYFMYYKGAEKRARNCRGKLICKWNKKVESIENDNS